MIWVLRLINKLAPFVEPVVNVKRLVTLFNSVMKINKIRCFMFSELSVTVGYCGGDI